jgi:hypothetical protein
VNMTELITLCEAVHADHGWRFRYVDGRWWSYDGDDWVSFTARQDLAKTIQFVASVMWSDGHSALRQVNREYMIKRLVAGMVPYCRADRLPGCPKPGSRPPSSAPAL